MDQQQFDALVELFENAVASDGEKLNMHYLLVKQGAAEYCHAFNGRTEPSDIRSLSKTVMALIFGTVVESRDDLSPETDVWPLLAPLCELRNAEDHRRRITR